MPLLEKEVVSGIEAGSGPAFYHPGEILLEVFKREREVVKLFPTLLNSIQ